MFESSRGSDACATALRELNESEIDILRLDCAGMGPREATKPVLSRRRINPSQGKMSQTGRKYYRPFWPRSLTGAAFRPMSGRTVNPQVPGSSPGRGTTGLIFSDSLH